MSGSQAPLTVLVTRPREDAGRLTAELAARGVAVVIEPLMTIVPRPDAILDLVGVQAVLLTSANGARVLAGATTRRDLRVLAVGDQTAATAREAGFTAVESAGGNVEDLARIAAVRLDPKAGALLHVAGRDVTGDLAGRLARDGFAVRRAALYEAEAAKSLSAEARAAIAAGHIDAVLLFSPRTADTFVTLLQAAGLAERTQAIAVLCLSPAVAAAMTPLVWRAVVTAAQPTQAELLAAFDRWRGGTLHPESTTMADTGAGSMADKAASTARPQGPVIDVEPVRPLAAPTRRSRAMRLILSLILGLVLAVVAVVATRPVWQDRLDGLLPQPGPVATAPSPAPDQGEVAALRAQLATALDRLAQSDRRGAALAARIESIESDLASLRDGARLVRQSLAEPISGGTAPDDRVPALIGRLTALEAEIKALPQVPAGPDPELARRLLQVESALKALPNIDPAQLAGIRAAAEKAGADQIELGKRLAALETAQSAGQGGARRGAALALAVGQLGQALRGASSFQPELDAVAGLAGVDAAFSRALEPLRAAATSGVATLDQLRQRFPAAVSAVKQEEARGADEGLIGEALARLARLVTIRRIDGAAGVDGALARAEAALGQGDLAGAVAALAALPDRLKAAAGPWVAAAEARLGAERALAQLSVLAAAAIEPARP
jgi:uroporphyrinogen-III synthase